MFKKLFSSKPSKQLQAPTAGSAINKLREIESTLLKKQEYLETKVQKELAIIKKNGTRNKRESLMALKRKKRLEGQLNQIDGTLTTIEYQREALENSDINREVLDTMKVSSSALKSTHGDMSLDQVEDLFEDIREQQEVSDQIRDAISSPMGTNDMDEEDLMRELEELEQDALSEGLRSVDISKLPAVPSTSPAASGKSRSKKGKEEEDEEEAIAQ